MKVEGNYTRRIGRALMLSAEEWEELYAPYLYYRPIYGLAIKLISILGFNEYHQLMQLDTVMQIQSK